MFYSADRVGVFGKKWAPRGTACALVTCLVLSAPSIGYSSTGPYPVSQVITGMTWDLSTVSSMRKANGSDLWPMTWASDGNLYGAWGDGGGFDGNSNNTGRVSLGFAQISGIPQGASSSSYSGKNIWGAAPNYALKSARFGGKIGDLISINGVLYGEGNLWTSENCSCSDPVQKPGGNPTLRYLTYSSDLGRTWTIAPWTATETWGGSLQYGQDYSGAWDPEHVYLYYGGDVQSDPHHMYLRRVSIKKLTENPATSGHYEYWIGQQADGTPIWSTNRSSAIPIFTDVNVPQGASPAGGAVYDAALGRYILIAGHGNSLGQVGFFEGPHPWGPWATIAYYDDWGGYNETAGEGVSLSFPTKWISGDGKVLWAVFSGVTNGFDSFNLAKVSLVVNSAMPQLTTPALGSVLVEGNTVTAQGVGSNLTWSAALVKEGGPAFATAKGNAFTFVVPNGLAAGETIRVTLTNSTSSLYRDYHVSGSSSSASLPNVTIQSVSSGASYHVSSAKVGAVAYIDRSYIFTQLSAGLTGARFVQAANDDKWVTSDKYLQFSVDSAATLYVCYSAQATALPAWLDDGTWTLSAESCGLNDNGVSTVPRVVYEKKVSAGSVTLGGNRQAPSAGVGNFSNYLVLVSN